MTKNSNIIDIIFPATSCTGQEVLAMKNYLHNLNLVPRILFEATVTPRANHRCSLSNFSAQVRFKQLYEALKSQDSKLVWCGRGGYSSGDLLPFLAKSKPIEQNKMFIGFSDITSISTFLQQNWGWKIICAPLPMQLIKNGKLPVNKKAEQELLGLIFGKITSFKYALTPLGPINQNKKNIKAEIVGGCLSVLSGHFGGNFQINFADKILFLEDVEESGERLDRYFRQIIEVILRTKQKPKAILLGEFCYGIKDKFLRENIDQAIRNLIKRIEELKLEIPVFKAKDALGHSEKMRPLILGASSTIKIADSQLVIPKIF